MMDHHEDEDANRSLIQRLIISINNPYKSIFDIMILVLIGYSCITTAYYISFDYDPEAAGHIFFENFVEISFAIDIILRFFHEYKDNETFEVVSDFKKIVKNYLTTWFIFDFIAVFPFNQILNSNDATFLRLFRAVRLPKFLRLLDVSKFDQILEVLLENTSRQEKMNYLYASKYIYKVIRLIIIAITLTYFLGCFWYYITANNVFNDDAKVSFFKAYNLDKYPKIRRLIMCCYFALTTLATVGYGDLTPQSNAEKIFGILIMILGVAFFSYIMGNFNDVLINYDKKLGVVDKGSDLQAWMTSLSKFTSNKPLPKELVKQIDEHFKFFWKHDRLSSLTPDDKYLKIMPKSLRFQLIKYLFEDIFQLFRGFLLIKEFGDSSFYYQIAFEFLPRKFEAGESILSPGEDIQEIYFILEGELKIGFMYEGELVTRFFGRGYYFGDYHIFSDNKAEYIYQANSYLKTLALPKYKFLKIVEQYPEIKSKMVSNSFKYSKEMTKAMINTLKAHLKKKTGHDLPQEELQKLFQENVQDKQKNQQADQGRGRDMNKNVDPKKLENISQRLRNTDDGLNVLLSQIAEYKQNVGKELEDIAQRLENIKMKLIDKKEK
eukprot:TRINITY_DN7278_c0_g2_i1.p1 TRINITY_DN7278_c0_g2~~TRINITY_DN7278_c0_g2_i1.p1  ORF type:complete len:606 (-),score=184.94 TRINITY_DN7278_c0_g2_i1:149-1966(-)